ncbi:isoprenylcysteine carboxylmethyltransferase family protein [Microcoleus sp. FACHB-1515]|uniref:methyltransferase family protein n=1 Tax=Cyanophyceae TaxID=3028117 RepID=UPI00168941E0|nr:isoprenylcysteine carboxylmethyltransferase family protein [Microcoleus sp. FACHB-1515]MBD2092311.1 isoprenylcysteine carboxylmethyltransferase family protein [Microcoleus sp. FACHB-1515]
MKLFSDWGFTKAGWRTGDRGEYWVVAQALLIVGFVLLPVYQPAGFRVPYALIYVTLPIALILFTGGILLAVRGLSELGDNLTPLPHPKDSGTLVQTGVYSVVRHPLYGAIVLAMFSWAVLQLSVTHLMGAIAAFAFFNAKASREEIWLSAKHPEYATYRQQVKKLLPWIY